MKKYYYIAILIIITTIVIISCKDGVVTPDDSNATPGRRDYTWAVDTVGNAYLDFISIWGDAPDNVWATGWLMSEALYHYDGNKWKLDNRVYISDPSTVWGYENRVWIGNDKGSIWKFTDNAYIQELKDFKINDNLTDFYGITGKSSSEIFAVGYNRINPIIMKYNGTKWVQDKMLPDSGGFNQIFYSSKNDKYYLNLWLNDYSTRILEYDRTSIKTIYKYPPNNVGPTIAEIDGYPYLVIDVKIYRYFNGNMEFIFEVDDPSFGGVIWGRNRNDILIRMRDGIAHYNGKDWRYLFKTIRDNSLQASCVVLENDVFIPAKLRTGENVIYHGQLK
jgi:hypothetical protein